jgi:hypothetical protein
MRRQSSARTRSSSSRRRAASLDVRRRRVSAIARAHVKLPIGSMATAGTPMSSEPKKIQRHACACGPLVDRVSCGARRDERRRRRGGRATDDAGGGCDRTERARVRAPRTPVTWEASCFCTSTERASGLALRSRTGKAHPPGRRLRRVRAGPRQCEPGSAGSDRERGAVIQRQAPIIGVSLRARSWIAVVATCRLNKCTSRPRRPPREKTRDPSYRRGCCASTRRGPRWSRHP